jgi:hypothetical protein
MVLAVFVVKVRNTTLASTKPGAMNCVASIVLGFIAFHALLQAQQPQKCKHRKTEYWGPNPFDNVRQYSWRRIQSVF